MSNRVPYKFKTEFRKCTPQHKHHCVCAAIHNFYIFLVQIRKHSKVLGYHIGPDMQSDFLNQLALYKIMDQMYLRIVTCSCYLFFQKFGIEIEKVPWLPSRIHYPESIKEKIDRFDNRRIKWKLTYVYYKLCIILEFYMCNLIHLHETQRWLHQQHPF